MTRLPATSGGRLDLGDVAVGLGVEAQLVVPVAGEVELELALLGHGDVGEHGLVLAGLDAERPVGPGGGNDVRFQAQRLGQCDGDVHLVAHRRLVVRGVNGQRGANGLTATVSFPSFLMASGTSAAAAGSTVTVKAVLLRREVELS